MRRVFTVALVALLLSTPVGGTVVGSEGLTDPAPVDGTATTPLAASTTETDAVNASRNRLELDGPPTAYNYTRPGIDFGATVSVGDAELARQYRSNLVDEDFETTPEEPLLEAEVVRISERIAELRQAERRTVRSYARGESSLDDVARTLAMVQGEATALDAALARLYPMADSRSLRTTINHERRRIDTMTGPVKGYVLASIRGGDIPRISIAATESGYTLSVVDRSEGTYLREAVRYDNRRPNGRERLDKPEAAFDRLRQLYPETNTEDVRLPGAYYYPTVQIMEATILYPEGTANVYLDAATRDVFYEVRNFELASMNTSEYANTTESGLRVVVERTFENGPVRVTVVDAVTGTPVDAEVTVAGRSIARTGDDGRVWTIAPPSAYSVGVRRGLTTVTVNVTA